MTIRTIVSRVRSSLKETTASSTLSNRHIWNIVYTAFLKVLDQRKRHIFSFDLFQTIDVETEEVNLLESSCVPLNCMGCRVKLPDNIETTHGVVFKYIATPLFDHVFKLVSPKAFPIKKRLKGKGSQSYAYYDDGYLYFDECFPCLKIAYLSSEGVGDEGAGCSKLDNKINIPDPIINDTIGIALNELTIFLRKPQDHSTNKSNNS